MKAHREFVSEAEEILDRLRTDLADLDEVRREPDPDVDPDLVNQIFRSAHSLKGLAGMFELDGLQDLAHHLEDVLDGLRLGRVSANAPAVDLLYEAVSLFTTLLQHLGDDEQEELHAGAITDLVARIGSAIHEPAREENALQALSIDPSLLRALTEYEEHRLKVFPFARRI